MATFIIMLIAGVVGAYNDWSFYQMIMAVGIYLIYHRLDEIKDAIKEMMQALIQRF